VRIVPWSRWITPSASGLITRRFDTRFFAAQLSPGQSAIHADRESAAGRWLTPRAGLALYWHNEIALAPPQIITLAHMARYATEASLLEDARRQLPRPILPVNVEVGDQRFTCYPGDEHHPVREPPHSPDCRVSFFGTNATSRSLASARSSNRASGKCPSRC
jgi:hypothetical protein